jgi:hypothetical protein
VSVEYYFADNYLKLYAQSQAATQAQYDRSGNLIQIADAEIARYQEILRQITELQTEWEKVRRVGEIVKAFKERLEEIDRRL